MCNIYSIHPVRALYVVIVISAARGSTSTALQFIMQVRCSKPVSENKTKKSCQKSYAHIFLTAFFFLNKIQVNTT